MAPPNRPADLPKSTKDRKQVDFGRKKEVFPLVLIQEGRVEKCTVLGLKNKREKAFLPFKTQLFHIQVVRYAASGNPNI